MKGKIIGKEKLRAQLKEMNIDLKRDLLKQMRVSVRQMESDAKVSINTGQRTGRFYTRNGKLRRRSAPGELPKTDTGDLVSRFSHKTRSNKNFVRGELNNNSDHAAQLEFGSSTKGGRPFMRPLWEKWSPLLISRFSATIKLSLKKNESNG